MGSLMPPGRKTRRSRVATCSTSRRRAGSVRSSSFRSGLASVDAVLSPGTVAPAFVLPDERGNVVTLSELRGQWVLLWWYPKAATPG